MNGKIMTKVKNSRALPWYVLASLFLKQQELY